MNQHAAPRCRHIVTKAGVVIGGAWTPPPPRPSADQEAVQRALLDPRTSIPARALHRLVGAVIGWL